MEMRSIHLIMDLGPHKGAEFHVPPDGARLGRAARNDIVVDDIGLSRHHCRFFFKNGELWVADLGSANGTTVNGRAVQEAQLKIGDKVYVGGTILKVLNDGVRDALRIKQDPDFVAPAPARRPMRAPPWLQTPAWLLLLGWLLLLAYSLIFVPPGERQAPPAPTPPPPRAQPPAPSRASAWPEAQDKPAAQAPSRANARPAAQAEDRQTQWLRRVRRDVARSLAQERFRDALDAIQDATSTNAPDWRPPELVGLSRFVRDVSRIDTLVAAGFAVDLDKEIRVRYEGRELAVIPRAIAGANVSAVQAGEGQVPLTLAAAKLDRRERSRRLGTPDTPDKNAMQFILRYRAGDFAAASNFALASGPMAEPFMELLGERRPK